MNWLRLRKATQPDCDEDGVPGRPQWDADYRLQAFPPMGMFEEYLEMGESSLCIHLKCVSHKASNIFRPSIFFFFSFTLLQELISIKSLIFTI